MSDYAVDGGSRSPTLPTLPDEVWREVARSLSIVDRFALARTCQNLHSLLWPSTAQVLHEIATRRPPSPLAQTRRVLRDNFFDSDVAVVDGTPATLVSTCGSSFSLYELHNMKLLNRPTESGHCSMIARVAAGRAFGSHFAATITFQGSLKLWRAAPESSTFQCVGEITELVEDEEIIEVQASFSGSTDKLDPDVTLKLYLAIEWSNDALEIFSFTIPDSYQVNLSAQMEQRDVTVDTRRHRRVGFRASFNAMVVTQITQVWVHGAQRTYCSITRLNDQSKTTFSAVLGQPPFFLRLSALGDILAVEQLQGHWVIVLDLNSPDGSQVAVFRRPLDSMLMPCVQKVTRYGVILGNKDESFYHSLGDGSKDDLTMGSKILKHHEKLESGKDSNTYLHLGQDNWVHFIKQTSWQQSLAPRIQ